jgi:S-DNA-T family DNA segregation ATPase FtsK/SpoIIIE
MANRIRKPNELKEVLTEIHENTGSDEMRGASAESVKERKKRIKSAEAKNLPENDSPKIKNSVDFFRKFLNYYQQPRTRAIWGIFLIVTSVCIAASFISYFINYKNDYAALTLPFSELMNDEVQVNNVMGKTGGFLAHRLIFSGYGVFAFLWALFFALWGLKRLRVLTVGRSAPSLFMHAVFLMIWGTTTLNFFDSLPTHISGNVGYLIHQTLRPALGYYGLLALTVFVASAYGIWFLNLHLLPSALKTWISEKDISEDASVPASGEENSTVTVNEPSQENDAEPDEENIHPDDIHLELKEILEESGISIKTEEENPAEDKQESAMHPLGDAQTSEQAFEPSSSDPVNVEPNKDAGFEIVDTTSKEENLVEENTAARLVENIGEFDPTLELSSFQFPNFDLLNDYGPQHGKVNEEEIIANKNRIVSTLKNYNIEIERITATVGPTVTLYEVVPAPGIRIAKIKNLEDDIALSLSAMGIRIIAPIPGKGTVGIEVPNQNPEIVPMRNILASEKFNQCTYELPIALGKTISNEIFIADLAKMPHLLMAGATGQGKSVGLNAILVSLLYKKHPAQLKFVLVDPKKVELTLFNKIERHYLAKLPNSEDAIITDNTKVIHTLNSLCIEMDNRYALLQDAAARNIKEYNQKFIQRKLNPNEGHKYLPYIVLVVDEFADLIMTAGKEVETPIARLAQLARAVGIHLIIATQRPSVNIITGVIKANFPARIAFRVTSKIDSRTILDSGGAEQLIGRGDMLLSTGNDLIRIQCAFVDTPEVERITEFIGSQRGYPSAFLLPEYVDENGESVKEEVDLSSRDKMFEEAARLVVQFQQGSASFLQRKLKLGYNRAGRIVDQLEAAGIVGPFEGSKAREVLIKDMHQLEEILKNL